MASSLVATGVQFPDSTTQTTAATGFGFKNRIINSAGLINQRGVSGTVTLSAGAYGHDRFKAGASGCTYTFSTSNNVTTFTITAGSLIQVIEGLNLESGTYCLSWTGTAQGKIGAGSYSASGVTGSITGGTNTNIEFNTGTLSLPQLEKGSTATSFDYRPYGTELALCQRYLPAYTFGASEKLVAGQAVSTTQVITSFPFPVTARTAPTGIAASAGSSFALADASLNYGANQTGTAIAFESGGISTGTVRFTCTSGLVAGNASIVLSRFAGTTIQFTGCEL